MRVLLVAPNASARMGGEAILPLHWLRELRALGEAKKVPHLVQSLLPAHRVRVVRGQFLELLDPAGERVAFADLVRLATHYDLDTEGGQAELLAELLARDPALAGTPA